MINPHTGLVSGATVLYIHILGVGICVWGFAGVVQVYISVMAHLEYVMSAL